MMLRRLRAGRRRRRGATCSRVVRLVATPRPWLPYCGLTTTGRPMSCGRLPGVLGVGDRPARRAPARRPPGAAAGQLLVLGDGLGDGAGAVGLGGADAPLRSPVAELDQAAVVRRRTGMPRCRAAPDDGRRARAEADLLGQGPQPVQFALKVKGVPSTAARQSVRATSKAARPSSSSVYSTMIRKQPSLPPGRTSPTSTSGPPAIGVRGSRGRARPPVPRCPAEAVKQRWRGRPCGQRSREGSKARNVVREFGGSALPFSEIDLDLEHRTASPYVGRGEPRSARKRIPNLPNRESDWRLRLQEQPSLPEYGASCSPSPRTRGEGLG